MIKHTLGKESNVYLLDEPSAFLDVEQRLAVAKMIRNIVEKRECSSIIIDHDLLFLSQIADNAMVFLGKPGKHGEVDDIHSVEYAFNKFLKEVNITFRTDKNTGRPRANKTDSQIDQEQKEKGKYFSI